MARKKDINKIKIIHQSAMELLIKKGFVGLKMADVAKESGIATGTIYIYYKTKEELINNIYLETKNEILATLLPNNDSSDSIKDAFEKIWMSYFDFCQNNPEKMLFIDHLIYSGYISKETYQTVEEALYPIFSRLENAINDGNITNLELSIIKSFIEGSIHQIIKMSILNQQKITLETKTKLMFMTWNALKEIKS